MNKPPNHPKIIQGLFPEPWTPRLFPSTAAFAASPCCLDPRCCRAIGRATTSGTGTWRRRSVRKWTILIIPWQIGTQKRWRKRMWMRKPGPELVADLRWRHENIGEKQMENLTAKQIEILSNEDWWCCVYSRLGFNRDNQQVVGSLSHKNWGFRPNKEGSKMIYCKHELNGYIYIYVHIYNYIYMIYVYILYYVIV